MTLSFLLLHLVFGSLCLIFSASVYPRIEKKLDQRGNQLFWADKPAPERVWRSLPSWLDESSTTLMAIIPLANVIYVFAAAIWLINAAYAQDAKLVDLYRDLYPKQLPESENQG